MEEQASSTEVVTEKGNSNPNIKGILILLGVIIVFGSIVAWGVSRGGNNAKKETAQKQQEKVVNLAPNTVVYGFWTSNNSVIASVDLSTGQNNVLGNLPSNIKHVKVVSNKQIAFIKDTDDKDYGKELVVHTLNGSDLVVAKADDGFGIDDYALSPNGKYMSTWEVSLPSNSSQFLGGRSRVYSIDVANPGKKNILYDETSGLGKPVHYPVAVTNGGDVYTDRFLPNSGAGWAYGMSMSNFTGTVKSDISSMPNGTYATQPVLSPDGTKLAFAGYDGSKGDGTQDVNGYRRALTIPNTVETLDLSNQTRTKLVSTAAEDIYPSVSWDLSTGDIIYSVIARNNSNSGTYTYSYSSNASKKIIVADAESFPNEVVQTTLSNGALLAVEQVPTDSALGNLSSKYAPSLDSMYVISSTGDRSKVALGGGYVQFIGLKEAKFFAPTGLAMPGGAGKTSQGNQLQLQTFAIKPTLAPVRIQQQSGTACRDVAAQQCNQLHGTSFSGDEALARIGNQNATGAISRCGYGGTNTISPSDSCDDKKVQDTSANAKAFDSCFVQTFGTRDNLGACTDSPLYLYGKEGSTVDVSVGTPIYSPNAPYNPETGFAITLGNNGGFTANGKAIDSLAFDYTPAIKRLSRPGYGVVVKGTELESAIREYSSKLGLNQKETQDTVDFAKGAVNSPFVYLSFYDNATSKQILPLYFSPQPDTYHNIVFYFEGLSAPISQPNAPEFEKIVRRGFTAIEVSYIVK